MRCLSSIAGNSNLTDSYVLPAISSAVYSFSDAPSTIHLRHRVKWASKYLKTDMAYPCAGDFVNWETRAGLAYSLRKQSKKTKRLLAFKLDTALSGHWKDGRSIGAYLHCSVFCVNFDIQIAMLHHNYEIMWNVVLAMHMRLNVSNLPLNQKINRSKTACHCEPNVFISTEFVLTPIRTSKSTPFPRIAIPTHHLSLTYLLFHRLSFHSHIRFCSSDRRLA